jgi:hypothetical protein
VNLVRSLYLTAALLTVAGLGLRLVPLPEAAVTPAATPPPRDGGQSVRLPALAATAEIDSVAAGEIVASNIFTRARVAPARVVAATVNKPRAARPPAPTFTLYGTTIGPEGAVALIDASTAPGGAQIHQVGDVIADARLVAITDSSVTLQRPSGLLILRLPTTAAQKP